MVLHSMVNERLLRAALVRVRVPERMFPPVCESVASSCVLRLALLVVTGRVPILSVLLLLLLKSRLPGVPLAVCLRSGFA